MNDAKRTSGKWKQYGNIVYSPDNGVICQVSEPHLEHKLIRHVGVDICSPDWKEAMANAAFIVRAANAHDALVAALRAIEWIYPYHDTRRWCPRCYRYEEEGHCDTCQTAAAITLATEVTEKESKR